MASIKISTEKLFTFRRLDLVVKYLYASGVLRGCVSPAISSLYARHILMRTTGIEPVSKYGNTVKQGVQDYYDAIPKLLASLTKNGFDEKNPVPIAAQNGLPLNGAHRIACARALRQDIYVEYQQDLAGYSWDFNWFLEKGFSTEDQMRILKGFVELNPENSALTVVWHSMFKNIGHIRSILTEHLDIVGEIELDLEDNFIAFKNILWDIYEPINARDIQAVFDTIVAKAELLQAGPLRFKVILLTNQEKSPTTDIHETLTGLKQIIRECFDVEIPKEIFATLHASSNAGEAKYIADVLLSPNNIKHVKMRLDYRYEEKFMSYCRNARKFCLEMGIDTKDICFIGSSVLTVFGIKRISDMDFTTKYFLRERLGNVTRNLLEGVDLANKGADILMPDGETINDEVLVDDCEYHFIFNGLKFINLAVVKKKKILSSRVRDKDLAHLRQIELYENYIGQIEQKRIFKERVLSEQQRRWGKQLSLEKLDNQLDETSALLKRFIKKSDDDLKKLDGQLNETSVLLKCFMKRSDDDLKLIRLAMNRDKFKRWYIKYRILSKISFGKKAKGYLEKKRRYRELLKAIQKFATE
ncbi:MAG: hypothetical protein LBK71_04610 [Verrucomicrobiales bacterium]|jgi:hypothetical protein|nr:hypothetical protein [Verrucomicrobiales bacterium]